MSSQPSVETLLESIRSWADECLVQRNVNDAEAALVGVRAAIKELRDVRENVEHSRALNEIHTERGAASLYEDAIDAVLALLEGRTE